MMKKKSISIVAAIVLAIALVYGFLAWRASEQANTFQPEGICTASTTKARHNLTGITATFSSGCIPDGWTAIKS